MEEWRPIEGYHPYEVSSLGRVRREGRVLKGHLNSESRLRIDLSIGGVRKRLFVHRLVAITFIPNPEEKSEVDHINGDFLDNRVANLRWSTRSENEMNTGMFRHNTSGYKGVVWCAKANKWAAQIHVNNEKKHLGLAETPEEAAAIYHCAADFYFGEFHRAE